MGKKIDWDDPAYHAGRIEKVAVPPGEKTREAIINSAATKIHQIVNNCLRVCGAAVDDGNSEATWTWIQDLTERMEKYILLDQQEQQRLPSSADNSNLRMIRTFAEKHAKNEEEAIRFTSTLHLFAVGLGLSGERLEQALLTAAKALKT